VANPKYTDIDSDTDFLDLPPIEYSDGTALGDLTLEELQQRVDPEWRREHGLPPLPQMPPPVDH